MRLGASPIRRLVALLALAMACRSPAPDGPPRTIVCAGDSNSIPTASWCDLLAAHLPPRRWRVVNVSIWGTTARGWVDKRTVERLVAPHRPDVVFFALGTNDACVASAVEIVDALLTLAMQAGGRCAAGDPSCPRVILATIPPSYLTPPIDRCGPTIERANQLLRAAWPAYLLVDFDSWVSGPEWFQADGLHVNAEGQARRADAAFRALLAAMR